MPDQQMFKLATMADKTLSPGASAWSIFTSDRDAFSDRKAELEQSGRQFGRFVREAAFHDNISVQEFEYLTLVETNYDASGKPALQLPGRPRIVVIGGGLRDKWLQLGGLAWALPFIDEAPTGVGDGWRVDLVRRNQHGKQATIIWSSLSNVVLIDGDNRDKWLAMGGVQWGYPVIDTSATANGDGWYNHFKGYWTDDQEKSAFARNDARSIVIYGTIRDLWASLDWERGFLGWPKADEYGPYDGPDPYRIQYFDGGALVWKPSDGAQLQTPQYQVRFRGFHCDREGSDRGGSSEYYFVSNAIPRPHPEQIQSVLVPDGPRNGGPSGSKYYSNVDQNGTFGEDMVLYDGSADALILRITAMEQDEDDPDKYKDLLDKAAKATIGPVLGAVAGLITGGVGATAGEAIGNALAPVVSDAINGLLGTGNETLAALDIPIDIASLRSWLSAEPVQAPPSRNNIQYHFTTTFSGQGHQLTVYFAITH